MKTIQLHLTLLTVIPLLSILFIKPTDSQRIFDCEPSQSIWRYTLKTDDHPWETSFQLLRLNNNNDNDAKVLLSSLTQDIYSQRTVYSDSLCLSAGRYRLVLRDEMGDGFCCKNGRGRWAMTLDGALLAKRMSGKFDTLEMDFEVKEKDESPAPTFRHGELSVDVPSLGIRLSTGMTVRVVARANEKVRLANNALSSIPFHTLPDGAAVFPLSTGYVYVSNSEMNYGLGGVYGVYFDHDGNVIDYKMLLSGTTWNCSGGKTPWNTWISCEEHKGGQCWQVDPDPESEHHATPRKTVLGQEGGRFESVACDNSNPSAPIFFLTEDAEYGALRRYRANGSGWDALHQEGVGAFDYLEFLDNNRFHWTTDLDAAKRSQAKHFRNVEGIDYFEGMLYFVSKKTYQLYTLNLTKLTYTTVSTNEKLFGDGSFEGSPDQIIRGKGGDLLYFTEDGGRSAGVYALDRENQRYAIFEAYSGLYNGGETTGLAFSPDGKKMYASFQDCGCKSTCYDVDYTCGCLLEFSREDQMPFHGSTMSLQFHGAS